MMSARADDARDPRTLTRAMIAPTTPGVQTTGGGTRRDAANTRGNRTGGDRGHGHRHGPNTAMTANIEILTAVVATHPIDAATRTTTATITATTDTGISTCASVRTDTTTDAPPLPPGPPPSSIPTKNQFPTPDPKDAARKIPEPMDDTVRAVFFQIPPKAIAYFERHHKSDFGVKIYDFYSQFGDVEDVRPNHKNFRATVVYADVEAARRAVVFRRVLFWDKELKNVETRWARPEAEIERRREKKLAGTEEKKAEREAAAEKRKAEADEREAARVKAVEALRVKREHARRLAAIEAEKRALKEKLEAASAPKRPAESTTNTLKKGGDVAAAAAKLERDAKELRAKYEAMVAAKKRKSTEEATPAGGGNKRGKK